MRVYATWWGSQATCCFCYAVLATRWILQDQMHIQVSCCILKHLCSEQAIFAPHTTAPMLVDACYLDQPLQYCVCVHRRAGLSAASPHVCYASDHAAGALCAGQCTAQAKRAALALPMWQVSNHLVLQGPLVC